MSKIDVAVGFITFRPVKKAYTEEEISEMPSFERETARRNGYIEYQEVGRSDGSTPLAVLPGALLKFYLEFSAPRENAPDAATAILTIEATTWQRVDIPLSLIIGKINTVPSTDSIAVRQGGSADLTLETTSVVGPTTDVDYALGQDGGQWKIVPSTVNVPRGGTVTTAAKVVVEPVAPVGTFPVGLEVKSFERLQFRRLPFQLTVRPAQVSVTLLQPSFVATQGDRVTCDKYLCKSNLIF